MVHYAGKDGCCRSFVPDAFGHRFEPGRLSAGVSADEVTTAIQNRLKTAEARNVTVSNEKFSLLPQS